MTTTRTTTTSIKTRPRLTTTITKKLYMGGTPQRKKDTGSRGHRRYFLDGGNNWGGDTAQHQRSVK